MSTLQTLSAELKSWFPGIEPLALQPFAQRAYRDIRDARKWSFLKQVSTYFTPNVISAGTVTVTQFSASVVGDATAAAAFIAAATPSAPQPALTQQQFRLNGNPLYDIVGFDGVATLTLNRPYAEPTGAGQNYMIYQPYVIAPATDFVKWLSWVDPVNDYRIRRRNLYRSQLEVDRRDPNRSTFSIPIWLANHDYVTINGNVFPRFELWPHPVQQISYQIQYQIRGEIAVTDPLPMSVPDQLIIARARAYCYQMQMTQPNLDPKLAVAMVQFKRAADADFADLLRQAKREDDNVFEQDVFENDDGYDLNGPLDSEWLQSHDIALIG